jgi:hypothetical protein
LWANRSVAVTPVAHDGLVIHVGSVVSPDPSNVGVVSDVEGV